MVLAQLLYHLLTLVIGICGRLLHFKQCAYRELSSMRRFCNYVSFLRCRIHFLLAPPLTRCPDSYIFKSRLERHLPFSLCTSATARSSTTTSSTIACTPPSRQLYDLQHVLWPLRCRRRSPALAPLELCTASSRCYDYLQLP